MTPEIIITLCIAALTGLIIGFFISRAKTASTLGKQQALIEQQKTQIEQLSHQQQEHEVSLTVANEQVHKQTTELAVLTQQANTLTTDRDNLQEQAGVEQNKANQLQQQFSDSNEQLATANAQLDSSSEKAQERQKTIQQQEQLLNQHQAKIEEVEQQRNQSNEQLATLSTSLEKEKNRAIEKEEDYRQIKQELKQQREKKSEVETERNQINEQLATLNTALQKEQKRASEKAEDYQQLKEELQQQRNKTASVETERNTYSEELATLKMSLSEKEEHFKQQLAQLDEQKTILKKEFQNLANEILEAKGKAFSEQNKESMDAMLNPFKEQLEGFRKRVDEVHTHQTEGNASLKVELTKLQELNQRITDEAANLTKALKGDKKKQGNWGEMQVEMILDQSGLRKGTEYVREANRKDEDNKNWRPDFIINLPENKHVIIDSKVSLNDYSNYVAADTDEEREIYLNKHVQAVRKHIDDLYKRDYSQLQGVNSPDFVFMFMPIEPAFIAAFEKEQSLFNNAFEKHIVVVTPTTLLATLRTISNLWSIERQNQNARILADQGAKVYDKLRIFVEKMTRLDGQISTVRKTYDEAYNTLTGSRSLTSTVQKFADLGVRVKKELPATVIESAQLDDETITRLEDQTATTEQETD